MLGFENIVCNFYALCVACHFTACQAPQHWFFNKIRTSRVVNITMFRGRFENIREFTHKTYFGQKIIVRCMK
jgi:hypothetical protein